MSDAISPDWFRVLGPVANDLADRLASQLALCRPGNVVALVVASGAITLSGQSIWPEFWAAQGVLVLSAADRATVSSRLGAPVPQLGLADVLGSGLSVSWLPAAVVCATDGACRANGRPGAVASYAALFTHGPLARRRVSGRVAPTDYVWAGDIPAAGFIAGGRPIAPSNNRGELLGMAHMLLFLVRTRPGGDVTLVTDSRIVRQTLLEWYPARLAAGTTHKLKNLDLVEITFALFLLAGDLCNLSLVHQNSHRPRPPAGAGVLAIRYWEANHVADLLAGMALEADEVGPVFV